MKTKTKAEQKLVGGSGRAGGLSPASSTSSLSPQPSVSASVPQRATLSMAKEAITDALAAEDGDGDNSLRLRAFLRKRLRLTGWRKSVRSDCVNYIRERGMDNVNVSHMLCDLLPSVKARSRLIAKADLIHILRNFAQDAMTVNDSSPPPIEKDEIDFETPYEYQSREAVPEPGHELLFCSQGPLPECADNYGPFSQAYQHSPVPVASVKSPLGGIVVLDRIDREWDQQEPEPEVPEQVEQVEIETEAEVEEEEPEEEELSAETDEIERLDTSSSDVEEQVVVLSLPPPVPVSVPTLAVPSSPLPPASPHSPSLRANEKKGGLVTPAEALSSKLAYQTKAQQSLASTLLTATARIAGTKSKHINLNSDDEDDEDDDEELMDI